MDPNLREQLDKLPQNLGQHIVLSGLALLLGIAISLPLALLVAKSQRLRWPVTSAAGVIQTVPSLALLALMVPLLGAFGFTPALVALVLYSMLPIVRNTVTGISNVDPVLVEAARGLGMTPLQTLRLVELPLALPVIIAGVRTATVWVVGVATLSTPVGQTSLGNYIFGGLQTRNWTSVLVGCIAAAVLAILLDSVLALLESAAQRRSRTRLGLALGALAIVFGGGIAAPRLFARPAPIAAGPAAPLDPSSQRVERVRIGAKTFTEQYILAALIQARLEQTGLSTERLESLGSTVVFDALTENRIDVYVDYSGTLWANAMKRQHVAAPWRVLDEVSGFVAAKYGARCLGALGFENAYALAMRRDRAQELQIRSVSDLARHAGKLSLGSDYEFFERPEWKRLAKLYGLSFASRQSFDSTFMYEALKEGKVDVITAFSSDGRIDAYDLVLLADPRQAFPPYQAILLLSPRVAGDERVSGALRPLLGALPVEKMRRANLMVDRDQDKRTPRAAASWLLGQLSESGR